MNYYSFVLLIVIIFPFSTYSQQITLEGKVFDQNEMPLEGAHIHINNNFVLADSNGDYQMDNIKAGSRRINISFIGFKTLDTLININDDAIINFKL